MGEYYMWGVVLSVLLATASAFPTDSLASLDARSTLPQAMRDFSVEDAQALMDSIREHISANADSNPALQQLLESSHFQAASQLLTQLQTTQSTGTPSPAASRLIQQVQSYGAPTNSVFPAKPDAPKDPRSWLDCTKTDWGPALAAVMLRMGGENVTSTLPVLLFYLHTIVYYLGCLVLG
eukprot:c1031_g1_i1.p1 GENE.c1031_g1_i1~~c1031_g1_i1.p1  ORF type:complete len:180 (-),score=30.19 c1031_g1_i1:60-599(-)